MASRESKKLNEYALKKHLAPQIFGELVDHRCDETLHGAELGVQAEEHQHEEEAGGPDWGEGHLQHGARVSEECETGSCIQRELNQESD